MSMFNLLLLIYEPMYTDAEKQLVHNSSRPYNMSDHELRDKEVVHRISSLYSNLECITTRYTKEDPKTNPNAKKQIPENQSTFRNKSSKAKQFV